MFRKRLTHEVPETIPPNPLGEVFFITICCAKRGTNQLATHEVWTIIDDSLRWAESAGYLKVRLIVAMPDHLHGLFGFPGRRKMPRVIADFKGWVSRHSKVVWQRDFFDHRLRGEESAAEKAAYIRQNPVRAGLVLSSGDWPFQR